MCTFDDQIFFLHETRSNEAVNGGINHPRLYMVLSCFTSWYRAFYFYFSKYFFSDFVHSNFMRLHIYLWGSLLPKMLHYPLLCVCVYAGDAIQLIFKKYSFLQLKKVLLTSSVDLVVTGYKNFTKFLRRSWIIIISHDILTIDLIFIVTTFRPSTSILCWTRIHTQLRNERFNWTTGKDCSNSVNHELFQVLR